MRGEMDGEDPGVIFDGLTGVSAPPPHDRGVQRLMVRLAARRRSQREGRSVRLLRPREMLSFRRALYRSGVRVRNARGGCERPRDITAAFYQRNPVALHRLLPWLQVCVCVVTDAVSTYWAFRNYSDPLTFYTFCHVSALF
nr:E3 ubiquitin-protein ligase Topors-like [Oncorhynchus nerka]